MSSFGSVNLSTYIDCNIGTDQETSAAEFYIKIRYIHCHVPIMLFHQLNHASRIIATLLQVSSLLVHRYALCAQLGCNASSALTSTVMPYRTLRPSWIPSVCAISRFLSPMVSTSCCVCHTSHFLSWFEAKAFNEHWFVTMTFIFTTSQQPQFIIVNTIPSNAFLCSSCTGSFKDPYQPPPLVWRTRCRRKPIYLTVARSHTALS